MACTFPQQAWYSKHKNESGKRSLVFKRNEALIDRPVTIPCGNCHGCKAGDKLMWGLRCYHEFTEHLESCFLTLTYDNDNLPEDGKIDKSHLQLFFKRLRRSGLEFRYFAVGEYGEQTKRPHYHLLIFGQNFIGDSTYVGKTEYTSRTISNLWPMGSHIIVPVSLGSIMYVCGYTQKKVADKNATFTLMSRRPGIGSTFYDKHSSEIAKRGYIQIANERFPIPKYYLNKNEELFIDVKKQRQRMAMQKRLTPEQQENINKANKAKFNLQNGVL